MSHTWRDHLSEKISHITIDDDMTRIYLESGTQIRICGAPGCSCCTKVWFVDDQFTETNMENLIGDTIRDICDYEQEPTEPIEETDETIETDKSTYDLEHNVRIEIQYIDQTGSEATEELFLKSLSNCCKDPYIYLL